GDAARERSTDTGDLGEQVRGRRIDVHADRVDAALHHRFEALLEEAGRDVVLILAYADALRVDLDQLGQRILQAARDGDGAADGQIELGELVARHVARAVDAGAGFADHDHRNAPVAELAQRRAQERLGLAPGGAVAHRDRGDVRRLDGDPQDLLRRF